MSKHLIIRVSSFDNVDPIEEIEDAIVAHGYTWFGKFGRPIGVNCFHKSVSSVLFLAHRVDRNYVFHAYKRSKVIRTVPTDGAYPSYYNSILPRISTWLKLRSVEFSRDITSRDFRVVSTQSPLSYALQMSMSAHFVCDLLTGGDEDAF